MVGNGLPPGVIGLCRIIAGAAGFRYFQAKTVANDAFRYITSPVIICMIRSFKSRETEKIWHGDVSRRLPIEMQGVARRKLRLLNSAISISDLRVPPGNMLEALKGNMAGRYSIRINDQWRICFRWTPSGPDEVEIVDCH